MDAKTYVKNVLITESKDFDSIRARMTDKNIRLIHASVGIASEIKEIVEVLMKYNESKVLDRVNLMEEISDCTWYIAIAAEALDTVDGILSSPAFKGELIKHDYTLAEVVEGFIIGITNWNGDLLDKAVKKTIFYGKPTDTAPIILLLRSINLSCEILLGYAGYTVEDARERNIAKLKARYGDKFTEAAALERNLEIERKILENK